MVAASTFVILAVGPEAKIDQRGFDDAVARAVTRFGELEQPQVARPERGGVNPSMDTLMRVAAGLEIEFTIDVRPAHSKARLVTKKAQTDNTVGTLQTEHAELLVAVA